MTTISISVTLIIIMNRKSEGICSCNVYDMTLRINMCSLTGTMCASAVFLGGLSLHLNHLIAEQVSAHYWQFGTLPIGIFLSNLVSGQLETSLMTSYCHF